MFVAALILLIIAVLLVVAAVFGGGASTRVDLGSVNFDTNVTTVFFLGMAALLVLTLSIALFGGGARRAKARRADRRKVSELSTKLDAYKREEHAQSSERDQD